MNRFFQTILIPTLLLSSVPAGFAATIRFDGISDQVVIGPQTQLQITGNTGTWEAWIKLAAPGGVNRMIMNKEGEYQFWRGGNGNLFWAIANSSPGWVSRDTGVVAPTNTWMHVAFVYNGTNMTLYTNGVAANSQPASGNIGDAVGAQDDFRIGVRQAGPADFFSGEIDEVRVWNVARAASEVAAWMNRALAGNEAGLLAYYRFQEGFGSVTGDSTLKGLFGTLTGGPTWNRAFDSLPQPIVESLPATIVTGTNAQLNALINTNRVVTTNFVRWGPGSTALAFDGVDDKVTVPHDPALNAYPITLTAWVRVNAVEPGAGNGGILNKYSATANGWRLIVNSGQVRALYYKDANNRVSSEVVTVPIEDGQWHHVAFTVDATGGKVYLDGTLSGSAPWVGTPGPATIVAPVEMGLGAGDFFEGQLDDAAVWNTALNATAIADLIAAGQTTGHAQYSNVVAHWNMNAGTGTVVADVSGHGRDGTFGGFPVWRPEARPVLVNQTAPQTVAGTNRVLDLNGVTDYVDVPDGVWFNGNFTVEFKAFVRRYSSVASFLDFGNGPNADHVLVALDQSNPGRLKLWTYPGIGASSIGATTPVPLNQWVHLAVTLQGSIATLYQDGAVVARGAVNIPVAVLLTNAFIGRPNWTANTYPDALMDDVRIWNTARTGDQIRQFMNQPVDASDPALQLNYRFDESSGPTVVDSRTTNPQDGTLAGGAARLPQSPLATPLAGLIPGAIYHSQSVAQYTNGTTVGALRSFATLAPGRGTALWFDGTKDFVAGANTNLPVGNSPYTIEAWIKPDAMNSGGIVGWGNYGFSNQVNAFRLTADGLHNYWWNNDLTVNNVLLTDRWHHVAATFDGSLRHIVVDGVERAVGIGSGAGPHNVTRTDTFTIGRTLSSEYFKGQIDEVRIWNVGRTLTELQQNMNERLTGSEPGLVAYYRMDEGDGPVLQDAAANPIYALIQGDPQRIGSGAPVGIPVAVTLPATAIAGGNATLNGTVNGEGTQFASYWFEYGVNSNLTATTPIQSLPPSIAVQGVSFLLTNLQGGQLYSYRLVAANSNGTNVGAPQAFYVPFPASAYAMQFNGSNYVNMGSSPALKVSSALSVEAWIYPTGPGLGTGGIILNKEGEYEFARYPDGTLRWAVANTTPGWTFINTTIVAPLNQWMHVAFVYGGGNMLLYTNGVLAKPYSPATGNIQDSVPSMNELWIGQRQAGGQGFQGAIDEVRVWNVPRSASDVAANYNRLLTGNEPGLLLYLHLDEGAGTTTYDSAPNHFIGSLVNNPTSITSGAQPTSPLVTTLAPTPVLGTSATLRGSVNPSGESATTYFQYGPTVAYGNASQPANNAPSLATLPISANLTGLEPGTTYHYRLVAYTTLRTNFGVNQTFTTLVLGSGWPVSTKLTGGEAAAPLHVMDGLGNSYVAGVFSGSAKFRSTLVPSGGAGMNAFVGKMSRTADWLSAVNIPASSNGFTLIKAIALDSSRNVYVAGQFSGTNTFGGTQLVSNGDTNLFVAKLGTFGTNWLWAKSVGGVGPDSANALTVIEPNIFVAGSFSGTANFAVTNLVSAGGSDVFVASLDLDGNWLWGTRGGGPSNDVANTLVADSTTNLYIAGHYSGTNTYGSTTLSNAGGTDLFVAKLTPAGTWVLARRGGGTNNDTATALARDAANQFYLAGQFGGTADYGGAVNNLNVGTSTNLFVLQLNTEALFLDYTQGGQGTARSVSVDSLGRVYVAGDFPFALTLGTNSLISSGNSDVFVAQMVSGNWTWAQKIGSAGTETAGSVSVDADNTVVVSGTYQGTIQIGYVELTSPNNHDIFIARLDANHVFEHNNYVVGQAIPVPLDAQDSAYGDGAIGQPIITILERDQVDSEGLNSFEWGLAEHKLYPVRQVTAIFKWPLTTNPTNTTAVVTAVGRTVFPTDPVVHIANAPAEVEPVVAGFPLKYLKLAFSTNGAGVDASSKVFNAPQPGWAVLQFLDTGGDLPNPVLHPSKFEVVRTFNWNDPQFLHEESAEIGTALSNPNHNDATSKNGYVYFQNSLYDGTGDERAYDRASRTGPIIPVNKKEATPVDDLVVVWYGVSGNGIAWPNLPVRYSPQWPTNAEELVLASRIGSGPLPLDFLSKRVYRQPNPNLAGFNPNEEHAALYGDTIYALRNDLNNVISPKASEPYTLLKYLDPASGEWAMKVYKVVTTNETFPFAYNGVAGEELILPEPLNSLALCHLSNRVVSGPGFQDYIGRLYARAAGSGASDTNIVARYWYPLQSDFDGMTNVSVGTCVPWLDRLGGSGGTPVDITYRIKWPVGVPRLALGDTWFGARAEVTNVSAGLSRLSSLQSASVIYDQGNPLATNALESLGRLFDPLTARTQQLALNFVLPPTIATASDAGRRVFSALPYSLRARLRYDDLRKQLTFSGLLKDSVDYGGPDNPLLLINVLSPRERDRIKLLSTDTAFRQAIDDLYDLTRNPNRLDADGDGQADKALLIGLAYNSQTNGVRIVPEKLGNGPKALTAGPGTGSGYVTVVENNDPSLAGLPVTLHVIEIAGGPFRGEVKVLYPDDVFDQKLTLRHSADFGGEPQRFEFQWLYMPDDPALDHTVLPTVDATGAITALNGWTNYPGIPPSANGFNDITIGDGGPAGLLALADHWYVCRYRGYVVNGQTNWTDWIGDTGGNAPKFVEGWVKRVISGLNPFDARTDSFHDNATVTFASMLQQAGARYEADIAFDPTGPNLNSIGLIEAYETVLRRARGLSVDAGINYPAANNALLLAASRISDLYMLLGNEAYADAADPTIGFRTDALGYGTLAPSIFTFQNQLDSLLEEELVLLRGRDDRSASVRLSPVYNRLFWNFTQSDGEVAYAQAYNITDQNGDGFINASDARIMYPQGHGDAWGHYLTTTKTYYALLQSANFDWIPRSETILLAGTQVLVDYQDERKFARAAAAKAKAGAEIVDLTYRINYVDDPNGQFQGYKDTDANRAWGFSEWAHRAGSGAFFDWVVANAILPATDPNTNHVGIEKIDRTTVLEPVEIISGYDSVQSQVDKADAGLNPLGLAKNVVPFDIDPSQISAGKTHFEQIYDRAIESVKNTVTVFNHANQLSQALRSLQDTVNDFSRNADQQERDYKNRLIEIFGYPYAGDIGAGKTYPAGYDGPDLYHYMYANTVELNADTAPPSQSFTGFFKPGAYGLDTSLNTQSGNLGSANYQFFFPGDIGGDPGSRLETDILQVSYPMTAADYGFTAPVSWGQRRAPGELQLALSSLLQTEARLKQALANYDNLIQQIEATRDLLQERYNVEAEEMQIENTLTRVKLTVAGVIVAAKIAAAVAKGIEDTTLKLNEICLEAIPKVLGTANDATAPTRAIVKGALYAGTKVTSAVQKVSQVAEEGAKAAQQVAEGIANNRIEAAYFEYEIRQKVAELETLIREEAPRRLEVFEMSEVVQTASGEYAAKLAEGMRLIDERIAFRKDAAADTQQSRYQDMTFRIFRNDAIQKYRAQFDFAAQYVFLAAVAYDFETQLLGGRSGAGRAFLTDIIRQRALGEVINGVPVAGRHGLADPLARLNQNFGVLKGQLGFNNPQTETGRFSLRNELFRVRTNSAAAWRTELKKSVVANLWDVPEFRRYCRPFAPESAGPQPGLVIRFPTTVTFGLNYFGWPLGGGDSAYDSTLFATKVRSAGVWFSDYSGNNLSLTPRIYLVPAGADIMRSPSGNNLETREWRVVDQKIPVPFPIGFASLNDTTWIPMNDSLSDQFADIRRFSSFRAYHDSGVFDPGQTISDSRLIGRSVWNTDWILIIPGGTFLFDPNQGLDTFINSVSDIKIFFQTYAYSGN